MNRTERTNYQWVHDLKQNGSTRIEAIGDLREFLERGLYHYLTYTRNDLADRSAAERHQIAHEYARESLLKVLDNLAVFPNVSQFKTWAAKFAARVVTTNLRCTDSVPLAHRQMNAVGSYGPPEIQSILRIGQVVREWRVSEWEDDGGHIS